MKRAAIPPANTPFAASTLAAPQTAVAIIPQPNGKRGEVAILPVSLSGARQ